MDAEGVSAAEVCGCHSADSLPFSWARRWPLVASSPALAQGHVFGTVKAADGHPIKGATVTAENPERLSLVGNSHDGCQGTVFVPRSARRRLDLRRPGARLRTGRRAVGHETFGTNEAVPLGPAATARDLAARPAHVSRRPRPSAPARRHRGARSPWESRRGDQDVPRDCRRCAEPDDGASGVGDPGTSGRAMPQRPQPSTTRF